MTATNGIILIDVRRDVDARDLQRRRELERHAEDERADQHPDRAAAREHAITMAMKPCPWVMKGTKMPAPAIAR